MMNIKNIYEASLFAQMAYADNLEQGDTGAGLSDKLLSPSVGADDVTQAQADYFSANYRVIYQEPTTASGFSATLFQDVNTGEYVFSLRGTDGDGPTGS